MEVRSLSEGNKTRNQVIISSSRGKFLDELVISSGVRGVSSWIKWLFPMVPNAAIILP